MEAARLARAADVEVSRVGTEVTGTGTGTVPIYLVRHAKAGSRKRWIGPDDQRPLSRPGREQAAGLVRLLAGRPLARLVSSPYLRCVQTLEPLSSERELPVERSDSLAEGAPVDSALSLALASAQTGPTVLCTHGDVIELLLGELSRRRVPLETGGEIELEKGSIWILRIRGEEAVAAEYVPPRRTDGR